MVAHSTPDNPMHGTILTTQPDPCPCALCRINELYESYEDLEKIYAQMLSVRGVLRESGGDDVALQ